MSKLDRYRVGTTPPQTTVSSTPSPTPKRSTKKSKEDTKAYKVETRCAFGQCKTDAKDSPWSVDCGTPDHDHPACLKCVEKIPPITGTKVRPRTVSTAGRAASTVHPVSQKLVHISLTAEDMTILCGGTTGLRGNPKLTPITVAWYRWCARCWKKWEKLNGNGTASAGAKPTRRRAVVRAKGVEGLPGPGEAAASDVAGRGDDR